MCGSGLISSPNLACHSKHGKLMNGMDTKCSFPQLPLCCISSNAHFLYAVSKEKEVLHDRKRASSK